MLRDINARFLRARFPDVRAREDRGGARRTRARSAAAIAASQYDDLLRLPDRRFFRRKGEPAFSMVGVEGETFERADEYLRHVAQHLPESYIASRDLRKYSEALRQVVAGGARSKDGIMKMPKLKRVGGTLSLLPLGALGHGGARGTGTPARGGQRPLISAPHVAYFCMEFGLHESFPIYSGGLGVLAGDFIKSAHDLRLPVVAVGLRWERGYCVQRVGAGRPAVRRVPDLRHDFLRDTGVRVRVRVRGEEVPCTVWVTDRFGHAPLYLLEPQRAEHRWITHRLYEAGTDVRIAQEMLLGIGGVRALRWLGLAGRTPITSTRATRCSPGSS